MHIFSVYIVGGIELCSQLYFFLSYLKKSLRPLNLFFSGLLTFSVMWLSYGIVCSLTCMVHPFLFSLYSARAGIMCSILGDVLTLFLSLACYLFILKYFTPEEKKEDKYVMLFLLPVFLIFLLVEYIRREIYGNTILTDSGGNVLNAHHGQMLMLQVLAMASLVCVLMGYKKLEGNFRLGRELALLTQAESYLRQYVTEAKMHEEGTRSFRHDVKNHMAVLRELLLQGNTQQALHYMGDMEELAEKCSFHFCTNHPMADIVINRKLELAQRMGIDVCCSLSLPYPCQVRDIDLCIILSNALDNAREGCSWDENGERYIQVTGKCQGDFIFLEVSNSFNGEKFFREGTGLKNIRTVAKKYHGRVEINRGERTFVISILLGRLS